MIEIANKTEKNIDLGKIKKVCEIFFKVYGIKKDLSVAFIGSERMKKINETYRNKKGITDVLSFEGEDDFLGEILINYFQVKSQAEEKKIKIKDELIFILVHGLLHLTGMEDESEEGRLKMIKEGQDFIKKYIYD